MRTQAEGFQQVLDAFFDDCQTSGDCQFSLGVRVRQQFDALMDRIDRRPLPATAIDDPRLVGPGEAFTGVRAALYDRDSWPILAQGLELARRGDGSLLLLAVPAPAVCDAHPVEMASAASDMAPTLAFLAPGGAGGKAKTGAGRTAFTGVAPMRGIAGFPLGRTGPADRAGKARKPVFVSMRPLAGQVCRFVGASLAAFVIETFDGGPPLAVWSQKRRGKAVHSLR